MSNPRLVKYANKRSEQNQLLLLGIREELTILMLAVEEAGMEDSIYYLTQVEAELRERLSGCSEAAALPQLSEGLH